MASPFQSSKKAVDMAAPVVRVSRIRRDPPPKVKEISEAEIKERYARTVVIGVVAFALALFVILFGVSHVSGWSMSSHVIELRADE